MTMHLCTVCGETHENDARHVATLMTPIGCTSCDWYQRVGSAGDICAAHQRMRTLASNLAIGAALCRADRNGCRRGMHTGLLSGPNTWRPGCRKDAP